MPVGDTGLLLLGIPLNAAILMKFAPMGPFMTELYPTNIRGTGQGFCYNAGRAIGSVFMTAIGFATAVMPLGTAIALFSTLAHADDWHAAAAPGDARPRHRKPRARSARRGGVSSPDGHRAQLKPRASVRRF